ncbi:hypothetical protein DOS84_11695 [Flavobacterium aquariorum]|uniref:Uncharacterized protein n=1 Tax=Flavobacterium aquariorum TaxID=2217670 RepID=A0A2W7TUB5_9FLAO|nr:hypothetical protein [Flavobacterium aquariorum]PZX93026.1 hypothetical protein DOS84_11695 [Flavobacterium aquariorum]
MLKYRTETSFFELSPNLKEILGETNSFFLILNGLPKKIIYQEYSFFKQPILNQTEILLGQTIGDKNPHNLVIKLEDKAIYHKWNFETNNPSYVYLGENVETLCQSLFINDFIIKRLILSEKLGSYQENHEKYAILLKELILDIESNKILGGAWGSLFEEMRLGVI